MAFGEPRAGCWGVWVPDGFWLGFGIFWSQVPWAFEALRDKETTQWMVQLGVTKITRNSGGYKCRGAATTMGVIWRMYFGKQAAKQFLKPARGKVQFDNASKVLDIRFSLAPRLT